MQYRKPIENIYKQVEKDTKLVVDKWFDGTVPTRNIDLQLSSVSRMLAEALTNIGWEGVYIPDRHKCKEMVHSATTREELTSAVGEWVKRVVLFGGGLGNNLYVVDDSTNYLLHTTIESGILTITLIRKVEVTTNDLFDFSSVKEELLVLSGKPSRVFTKLLGEEVVTKAGTYGSWKGGGMELHFTKHYIPELYLQIKEDERCSSCMSYSSEYYGLDGAGEKGEDLHPMMAYEGSPNTVLALLYDKDKGRYVARAMCNTLHGELRFSNSYGRNGCYKMFTELGLVEDRDNYGVKLSFIEVGDEFLLPYVDGNCQRVDRRNGMLYIDDDGEYEPNHELGRPITQPNCSCCGDTYYREDMYEDYNGELVCYNCRDSEYSYAEDTGALHHTDHLHWVERECVYYCHSRNLRENYFTGEWEVASDCITITTKSGYDHYIHQDDVDEALEDSRIALIDGEPVERDGEEAA
jgi:hypothetical protein